MNYTLRYIYSINVPECLKGGVLIRGARYLPRIGETIDFDGRSFTVEHVFHVIENDRAQLPTVRVK